jgi:serine/threonine protein kinase/formylglycine-generating enzyme required for sulfatase activity
MGVADADPRHGPTDSQPIEAGSSAVAGTVGDEALLERFESWEDRYRRDEDAAAEALGVLDSELKEALRGRIAQQKRLYAFMKFSKTGHAPEPRDTPKQPARSPGPAGQEDPDSTPERMGQDADPVFIGRYQVIRSLGEGGFGRVYLARDTELDRDVAVKVPVLVESPRLLDIEAYLEEARILAQLSHPNVVPVYDVGRTKDGRCYVVSKYMKGGDLDARIRRARPGFVEAAELIAIISEALHYTHTHDLFHRDIKPANILLDADGVPSLADFGLALRDENLGKGARLVGTTAYMSPEQARGEGHRVDGRSDIFSIGIILYELLTGRRPFRSASKEEVLQQIVHAEPRPPRQIDDTIPRELERICMRALAKRASDRYATARDLAEDLRHFLKRSPRAAPTEDLTQEPTAVTATVNEVTPAHFSSRSDSCTSLIRIIPKGLGSFDENDADFFLPLLPGPRDRDGLPEGLRFWKTRVEATDPDKTFRVGLIYGPSGSGKSSLIKAGLLPLLGERVAPVYVEARAGETEARLLRGAFNRFSTLPRNAGLVEAMAILRHGHGLKPGRKVLVVLDQFEQWLFKSQGEPESELVAALRQCDGQHLQALCLVRDDFWMAATRFMRDLEIDLVSDRNVAAVDLFDSKHARKVLAACGRAYETLPLQESDLSREQQLFLDQAVAGLAPDGRVVPVRLALFAEMVKGKPWVPATLRDVGGMDGVGVKYLEETFSSARSNPNHRYHQKAAQAVLKALLPESNVDIKGRMRSIEELRDLSGYAARPRDFDDLIRTLDSDLRLIAPVDPGGPADPVMPMPGVGRPRYQLTHDYLIHVLHEWLERKQRETRKGRAELLLAERAAVWNAKPERRYLPSIWEWTSIRLLTESDRWSESQRRMMKKARGKHLVRVLGFVLLSALIVWGRLEGYGSIRASSLVESLASADTENLDDVIRQLSGYRRWANPGLRRLLARSKEDSREHLHASLALLPIDRDQVPYLSRRLLAADPDELNVLRHSLQPYQSELVPKLWNELESGHGRTLLQAAGALALYDPDNQRWDNVARAIAHAMVSVNPIHVSDWMEILRPAEPKLRAPLKEIFRDENQDETHRVHATNYLVDYAADSPIELVDLLMDADSKEFPVILPALDRRCEQTLPLLEQAIRTFEGSARPEEGKKARRVERQGKAAVALVCLRAGEEVWPLLAHGLDPSLRSFIIHWLARLDGDSATPQDLFRRIEYVADPLASADKSVTNAGGADPNRSILFDRDTSIRRALILAVGHYDPDRLPIDSREHAIQELLVLYGHDPDAGIHGAAEWALRRWGQQRRLHEIDARLRGKDRGGRRWYINSQGLTFTIVEGPIEFDTGPSSSEPARPGDEPRHHRSIPHSFAIATKEVSVEEYQKYLAENPKAARLEVNRSRPHVSGPLISMTWYEVAAFCNWLSRRERLTECYEPNPAGEYAEGMRVKDGASRRDGYRLPTEAEWEYACYAGVIANRHDAVPAERIGRFACHLGNLGDHPRLCGLLLPNDLGLFQMLGNAYECCQHPYELHPPATLSPITDGVSRRLTFDIMTDHLMRGQSFADPVSEARSVSKSKPANRLFLNGFRLARTYPGVPPHVP